MRADRDDTRFTPERRNYTMPIVAGAVVLLAILLFIGLRDSDELIEQPAAVVRDSAIVEPPVIDTTAPAQQQATTEQRNDTVAQGPRGNFNERQLPPPTSTVGAGAAATPDVFAEAERLVIDGELLQQIEEDAEVRAGDASPGQLQVPR